MARKRMGKKSIPDVSEKEAVEKLGNAIFHASRVSSEDPVAEWDIHNKNLREKTDWLNSMNFAS